MGTRSSGTPLLPQPGIRRHSRLKLKVGISYGYFDQIYQLYSFFFCLNDFRRKFSFRRDKRNNSGVNFTGEGINCNIHFLAGFTLPICVSSTNIFKSTRERSEIVMTSRPGIHGFARFNIAAGNYTIHGRF